MTFSAWPFFLSTALPLNPRIGRCTLLSYSLRHSLIYYLLEGRRGQWGNERMGDRGNDDLISRIRRGTFKPSHNNGAELTIWLKSQYVCIYFCLSVYLSACICVCLQLCMNVCLSVCLSLCLSFVSLSVCLSVCLPIYLSVSLSFCQKCRKGIPSWLVFICFTSAAIPIHSCISNMSPPLGSTKLYGCIMISVLRPIGLLTAPSRASESQASCPIAIS